jgi:hypothetical protein
MRNSLLKLAVASLAILMPLLSLGDRANAQAAPVYRFCGPLPPGQGAFSYTNTRGVTCRVGARVAYRAVRRFCSRPGKCSYGPDTSPLRTYRGRVRYGAWRCRVKVGYELTVADCHSASRRIFHKSAA